MPYKKTCSLYLSLKRDCLESATETSTRRAIAASSQQYFGISKIVEYLAKKYSGRRGELSINNKLSQALIPDLRQFRLEKNSAVPVLFPQDAAFLMKYGKELSLNLALFFYTPYIQSDHEVLLQKWVD